MMDADPQQVTELMDRLRQGSKDAAGELDALFYPELRRLARSQMRGERAGFSWQPTVLVNQLYLELTRIRALRREGFAGQTDRQAFFGLAAHLMRRLLIHHARPLASQVRMTELADDLPSDGSAADDLAIVESLLLGLEQIDPELRAVAEMRIFDDLAMDEIAGRLDIPLRTAYRRWTFARTWLANHV